MSIFYLLLLFVAVHGSEGTVKVACQGDEVHLRCNEGETLEILDVFYGRVPRAICPRQHSDEYATCSSRKCKGNIVLLCDYKRFCRFRVSNYACGEASHWYSRTHKHLQVRYRCVEQKHHHHHHHHGHHHHDQSLPKCKANMVLVYNATSCPRTCPPERYYFKACSIIRHPTCICKHNWVIDHLTGNCVPRDKCPYYDYNHPSHTTHEHYTDCGTCELCPRDCNHPIVCASYCRPPGYYCDANYCRDSYGKCVRKKCCN